MSPTAPHGPTAGASSQTGDLRAVVGCDACGGTLSPVPELAVHGCWQCQSCGLVVCLPFPKDVGQQYGEEYFDRRGEQDRAGVLAKVESFRPLAADLRHALGAAGTVFEVGAAVGALVRALRDEGLDATGVELSEAAVGTAREILDVDLVAGAVNSITLPQGCGAVIALHVVEHLLSPRRFVEQAHAALGPKGLLVVEVPDFGAPLRQRSGPDWPYFRPGEHLYHFTESSLVRLLTSAGFAVRRVERHGGLGLLAQEARGAEGYRDPAGVARLLFQSRVFVYRVPGARRGIRWANRKIGYQFLRRHAHIRVWAERIQ